jgi:chromosome segregation ATPase
VEGEANELRTKVQDMERELEKLSLDFIDLRSELEKQKEYYEDQMTRWQKKLGEEHDYATDCAQELKSVRQDVELKETTINDLNDHVKHLEDQLMAIKEEAAQHISVASNLKHKNSQLCLALEAANRRCETLDKRVEDVLDFAERKEGEFNTERLKLLEKDNQQTKLIEFLQNKYESQKRPLFQSPFASSNKPPAVTSSTHVKELEAALSKERTTNRKLQEELHRTEAELVDMKMENKLIKANVIDMDTEGKDASAPPPPYRVARRDQDDRGGDSTGSLSSSVTTDNNEDSDDSITVAVQATVYADVHRPNGTRDSRRGEEFTFTDSVLEDLNSGGDLK